MKKVKNLLQQKSKNLFSVTPDTTVYDALKIMVEKNLGALIIMEDGKFTGIFTERDYARKVIVKGKSSKETPVSEIIAEKPLTVTPETTISDCMEMMTSGFVRYLPVIENNELVGLVSIGDIVKFIIEEQKYIIDNLQGYISGQ